MEVPKCQQIWVIWTEQLLSGQNMEHEQLQPITAAT